MVSEPMVKAGQGSLGVAKIDYNALRELRLKALRKEIMALREEIEREEDDEEVLESREEDEEEDLNKEVAKEENETEHAHAMKSDAVAVIDAVEDAGERPTTMKRTVVDAVEDVGERPTTMKRTVVDAVEAAGERSTTMKKTANEEKPAKKKPVETRKLTEEGEGRRPQRPDRESQRLDRGSQRPDRGSQRVVEKVLRSLTEDFEQEVMQAKESLKDEEAMHGKQNNQGRGGYDGHGRGRGQENNRQQGQTSQQNTRDRGRGRERGGRSNRPDVDCHNCGRHGHYARDCRADVECYNCGKYGHYAKECCGEKKAGENTNFDTTGRDPWPQRPDHGPQRSVHGPQRVVWEQGECSKKDGDEVPKKSYLQVLVEPKTEEKECNLVVERKKAAIEEKPRKMAGTRHGRRRDLSLGGSFVGNKTQVCGPQTFTATAVNVRENLTERSAGEQ